MTYKKVVLFFPHNPWPPKSGAHKRCLEIISGLKEIDCEIFLLSSTLSSENQWKESSIDALKKKFVKDVLIYHPNKWDSYSIKLNQKFYTFLKINPPLNSGINSPIGICLWSSKIIREIVPDIIFMNYCYWDKLINHREFQSIRRVIETHDLVTINTKMRDIISPYLSNKFIKANRIDDELLKENFFEVLNLQTDEEEYKIYDQYQTTIAISSTEKNLIEQNTNKTKVILLPMTQEPCYLSNQYQDSALFPIGPNLFNIQGYFYFTQKVLPQILQEIPSFSWQVTGNFQFKLIPKPEERVIIRGFVPDLKKVYELSSFVISPVIGGTGQQVKIVEAMAHGLPVIALKQRAENSPINHGINGFIANNAEEFADYVKQLWQDRTLCRKLGKAAQETIAANFSRELLTEKLLLIIS
ncbi:glycosyltransferase family 4 protein [Aphanothece sacrum]|uniref:Glycosyl transferase n=1 Tax=Aphanothece sacrum FPU1 TaxID=1920663 RepID=A0A401IID0_APHSA|nr:glycosyltransferase family 4 protein [Aphanothece sacrum]GBF80946.1 hypothetical protein AsFPU1_2355 [Aphanothece sacrum FPU1]GBF85253.1 hypothetical protein AsFPU3_2312 [Aphanothece sacrum FPU3]